MMLHRTSLFAFTLLALASSAATAQEKEGKEAADADPSYCVQCHGEEELWGGETRRFFVAAKHFREDLHWQKGLRCHDCHGGDPKTSDFAKAHSVDSGFRSIKKPVDVAGFCGHCHSNNQYMRQFHPSPRTDQEAKYWTSGHGVRLKETGDAPVATCVSCHSAPHGSGDKLDVPGILAVNNLKAPVYPTNVAKTCAVCHSDAKRMEGLSYHGRPIGHDQYEKWQRSVHAKALLEKGDLSAPTCNDCHGNHGAVPPEVDSVANACGACHTKVGKLFAETRMKHRFEEVGLPGCATCHGNHEIHTPTDEMLGVTETAVCSRCHSGGAEGGKFGATLAGADAARAMRAGLAKLKEEVERAKANLAHAQRLGMEVSGPQFDLRKAEDALTNARSLIHTFSPDPVEKALQEGLEVTAVVHQRAKAALDEYTFRRWWLAGSLVPITLVIVVLVLYIRSRPPVLVPAGESHDSA
ncbi:MAG: cytochrome c3 family protein [Pirellulales bacterium]|nr:cytochrome c3 family protein [Pirellulales bacterium]